MTKECPACHGTIDHCHNCGGAGTIDVPPTWAERALIVLLKQIAKPTTHDLHKEAQELLKEAE